MDDAGDEGEHSHNKKHPSNYYLQFLETFIYAFVNEIKSATTEQNNNKHDPWIKYGAIAAIAYAGLTFVIMVINGIQIYFSREAIVAANRAWIAPRFMGFNSPLVENGIVDVYLSIPNVGREPAIGVKYKFDLRGIKYIPRMTESDAEVGIPANITCDYLRSDKNSGLVDWPEVSYGHNGIPETFEDTQEHRQIANDALHRDRSMMVQGCIVYQTDGAEHRSRFRFFLRDDDHPSGQWHFNVMLTGNEAD